MSILVIDDEVGLRRSLCAYLEDLDYETLQAADGGEGLAVLDAHAENVEAVFVDLNMPGVSGYDFIRQAVATMPDIPIVVISGVGAVEDALAAMRLGAWEFIVKPVHNLDLLVHTLDRVLERARLLRENKDYHDNLERLVLQRTAELERSRRQIMQRLSRAAEYKDNETGRHVIRVGEISALLGEAMGLTPERAEMLRECAPLHDIGKIGIPDAVLLKPGALTPGEREIMSRHCIYGCEILGPLGSLDEAHSVCSSPFADRGEDNELLQLARTLALLHHERWDGKGYPFGIAGEEIPLEARIVAVVDVFDAVASNRSYKKAFPMEACLAIIRDGAGSQFDPEVVKAFFANEETIRAIREQWKDEE
jgi:putative two-component system response regulator